MVWIDSAAHNKTIYLAYGLHALSHLIYLPPNLAYHGECIIVKCFRGPAMDPIN